MMMESNNDSNDNIENSKFEEKDHYNHDKPHKDKESCIINGGSGSTIEFISPTSVKLTINGTSDEDNGSGDENGHYSTSSSSSSSLRSNSTYLSSNSNISIKSSSTSASSASTSGISSNFGNSKLELLEHRKKWKKSRPENEPQQQQQINGELEGHDHDQEHHHHNRNFLQNLLSKTSNFMSILRHKSSTISSSHNSASITNPDPMYRVIYLGNVVTYWAKGEGCLERPASALWRNYQNTLNNRGSIRMSVCVCPSGLKANTREHGLTEYWANRLTYCGVPKDHPKLFCWIYRHEGRKLKQELRCHAVYTNSSLQAGKLAQCLKDRLSEALYDFKREKIIRQNTRLNFTRYLNQHVEEQSSNKDSSMNCSFNNSIEQDLNSSTGSCENEDDVLNSNRNTTTGVNVNANNRYSQIQSLYKNYFSRNNQHNSNASSTSSSTMTISSDVTDNAQNNQQQQQYPISLPPSPYNSLGRRRKPTLVQIHGPTNTNLINNSSNSSNNINAFRNGGRSENDDDLDESNSPSTVYCYTNNAHNYKPPINSSRCAPKLSQIDEDEDEYIIEETGTPNSEIEDIFNDEIFEDIEVQEANMNISAESETSNVTKNNNADIVETINSQIAYTNKAFEPHEEELLVVGDGESFYINENPIKVLVNSCDINSNANNETMRLNLKINSNSNLNRESSTDCQSSTTTRNYRSELKLNTTTITRNEEENDQIKNTLAEMQNGSGGCGSYFRQQIEINNYTDSDHTLEPTTVTVDHEMIHEKTLNNFNCEKSESSSPASSSCLKYSNHNNHNNRILPSPTVSLSSRSESESELDENNESLLMDNPEIESDNNNSCIKYLSSMQLPIQDQPINSNILVHNQNQQQQGSSIKSQLVIYDNLCIDI